MITKQEYQRLKEICQSNNPDDVEMIGPVILNLRKNKKLTRRSVNELFYVVVRNKQVVICTYSSVDSSSDMMNRKHWQINSYGTVFGQLKPLEFKWKWLRGNL